MAWKLFIMAVWKYCDLPKCSLTTSLYFLCNEIKDLMNSGSSF